MSNIPEPKFKKGDKVKTNELFKHEYAGDPGFRGIVGLLVIFFSFFGMYISHFLRRPLSEAYNIPSEKIIALKYFLSILCISFPKEIWIYDT